MVACKNSGYDVKQCFVEVNKTLKMPNGGVKRNIGNIESLSDFWGDTIKEFHKIEFLGIM